MFDTVRYLIIFVTNIYSGFMNKLQFITIILFAVLAAACGSSIDTTTMSADEHFAYAMSLYDDEDYEDALAEFQAILLQYPANPVNDDAQYYLGMTYFQRGQYLLSAYEFSKLIRDIPASPFVVDAQFMLAESYFQLSPPYQLDQVYTKKAIEEFQAFIDFFPTDERVDAVEMKINEMNKKLAEKQYSAAVIYEKMEYDNAAIDYYNKVIETYHDTEFAPMAYYNRIKLLLSNNREEEALRDMQSYLSRYPDDNNASEIQSLYDEIVLAEK